MIMTTTKKLLSLILCALLAWTVAFGITGCTDDKSPETPQTNESVSTPAASEDSETASETAESAVNAEATELGEGDKAFDFTVTDKDGNESVFSIKTDKTTVGEALIELGLIEGEEGPYGLYVKKVNNILADYDVDGTYWAFYVNGEYASKGVELTEITAGSAYAFKVEK